MPRRLRLVGGRCWAVLGCINRGTWRQCLDFGTLASQYALATLRRSSLCSAPKRRRRKLPLGHSVVIKRWSPHKTLTRHASPGSKTLYRWRRLRSRRRTRPRTTRAQTGSVRLQPPKTPRKTTQVRDLPSRWALRLLRNRYHDAQPTLSACPRIATPAPQRAEPPRNALANVGLAPGRPVDTASYCSPRIVLPF